MNLLSKSLKDMFNEARQDVIINIIILMLVFLLLFIMICYVYSLYKNAADISSHKAVLACTSYGVDIINITITEY